MLHTVVELLSPSRVPGWQGNALQLPEELAGTYKPPGAVHCTHGVEAFLSSSMVPTPHAAQAPTEPGGVYEPGGQAVQAVV